MQKRTRIFPLLVLAAGGLVSLTACGGGGSSHGGGGGGGGGSNPTPSGPVTVYPGTASVPVGQKAQFIAYLPSQPNSGFTWSVSGSSNGTIDSNGMYTAPSSMPSPTQVTITAASTANSGLTGTAIITITAAQGLAVSPTALAVPAGTTVQFTATSGGSAVTPTWQVNGSTGGNATVGTILSNGKYTAPLTPPPGGSVTITAVRDANSGTAAATIVFSNKSLTKDGSTGSYAFSYIGSDSVAAPLSVVGSFQTDGNGDITGGVEDFNDSFNPLNPVLNEVAFTGSYSVGPDGRATATLASGGAVWQFTLISNQHALLIRFDTVGTGSGTIDLQNPVDFNVSAISGDFAFSFSGLDASATPLAVAGRFNADGVSAIPSGVEDINDGGSATSTGSFDETLTGGFALDGIVPNSGRGTLQLTSSTTIVPSFAGTYNFAFYIVDKTHLKVVEIDPTGALIAGDIFRAPLQPGGGFGASILNGKYAFTNGGADANGNPYAAAGVFNASPGSTSGATSGSITGVFDFNDGGTNIKLAQTLTGTYGVDPSSGRISTPFSIPARSTPLNYAAYETSSGTVLMIELDTNPANNGGIAYPQTTTTPVQGSFALNLSGVATKAGSEQDITGQATAASNGTLTGSVDFNNFQANNIYQGLEILSGSTIGSADSDGRGTLTIETTQGTFPLAYYIVDQNAVLLFETDSQRVLPGTLVKQF